MFQRILIEVALEHGLDNWLRIGRLGFHPQPRQILDPWICPSNHLRRCLPQSGSKAEAVIFREKMEGLSELCMYVCIIYCLAPGGMKSQTSRQMVQLKYWMFWWMKSCHVFTTYLQYVVKKANELNSALKFIRNKLTLKPFPKVLTSQFFSTYFYGWQAWLSDTTYYCNKRPMSWSKYQNSSLVMKRVRNGFLRRLKKLLANPHIEPGQMRFYYNAKMRVGKQNFKSRPRLLNNVDYDWTHGLTDGRCFQD